MKRLLALVIAATVLCPAGAAYAKKFKGSELLIGHSVKPPVGAKRFSVGVDLQFSPLDVVLNSQRDRIVDQAISAGCAEATADPACEENAALAMDTLSEVSDEDWSTINSNLSDTAVLQQTLIDAGVAPDDAAAVGQYVDDMPAEDRQSTLGLARKLSSGSASSFLIEPRVDLNLKWVYLSASLPLAMYMLEDRTDFNVGNFGVDVRFGKVWSAGVLGVGVSGGLHTFLPSGTNESDAMGFTNLFYGPKFFHSYLTPTGYFVVGLDVPFVIFQLSGEIVPMIPVRDAEGLDTVLFGKYGFGVTILPNFFVSVIGELNGLFPMMNADAYNALFVSGGLQFKLWVMKISLAAQFPPHRARRRGARRHRRRRRRHPGEVQHPGSSALRILERIGALHGRLHPRR
ncbi:MAG: hypothetical protein ABIK09_19975 [Pseudomonadota bacterium]